MGFLHFSDFVLISFNLFNFAVSKLHSQLSEKACKTGKLSTIFINVKIGRSKNFSAGIQCRDIFKLIYLIRFTSSRGNLSSRLEAVFQMLCCYAKVVCQWRHFIQSFHDIDPLVNTCFSSFLLLQNMTKLFKYQVTLKLKHNFTKHRLLQPPTEGELTVTSGILGRITHKWKNESSVSWLCNLTPLM